MACNYYDIGVSSIDLNNAVNNTSYLDFTLYVNYYDCDGNLQTTTFNSAGMYFDAFCADDFYGPVTPYYYSFDNPSLASNSTVNQAGACGLGTTPTPTSTPTPTNPIGCFSLSLVGTTSQPSSCGFQQDTTEQWRFTYLNGTVNQSVDLDYQYDFNPCYGSYQSLTGTTTMLAGTSTVDFYITSSQWDDCGYGPPNCIQTSQIITGVFSSSVSCATLETTPTPTTTTTLTSTPTITPTTTLPTAYPYLGRTTPDAGNSADACTSYLTIRPYYVTKSSLASIVVGDRFYDSYPSTPTNGNNNWIALKSSGVGSAYSFQIDTSGYVIQVGGECAPPPTPSSTPASTPSVTSTQTPTQTQTPTATPYTVITGTGVCNIAVNGGSGGRGYFEYTIQLGFGTGNVSFTYNAYSVPDQFQVYYNGSLVIDTGFRGDASYNSQLNALGYPNVSGPGSGSSSFTKPSALPETCLVVITAPLVGTAWEFLVGCPSIPPTPTPTNTPTTTTTLTATPTQTPTPTTTTTLTATPTQTPTQTPTPNACWNYLLGPNSFSTTYEYWTCSTDQSNLIFVAANTTSGPFCSSRIPTGGVVTRQDVCGSIPPSPTQTSTQTPTPSTTTTLTATPTQTPTTTTTLTATQTSTQTPTPSTTTPLTATPTQTPTSTTTLTATPTQTPTTTTTLTATPTQTATQTPTTTTTLTATPTQTSSQTPTTTTTLTATPTETATQTPTTTTTLTATPTQTATQTPTTTTTLTATPTQTSTQTPTTTTTLTATPTETATQTPTTTTTLTSTPAETPTQTPTTTTTLTATPTQTSTQTPTSTTTLTATPTQTSTETPTSTTTLTATPTSTTTLTATPTQTETPTQTPTSTTTLTATPTQTGTAEITPTPTTTTTLTATPTQTGTPEITPTNTSSPTSTPTQTPSHTPTNFPVEYAPNGFWYDPITNKLYASTSLTKRMVFDGTKIGINYLGLLENTLTINVTDNGFNIVGLSKGSGENVLVIDGNGVIGYANAPGGNVDQNSFVSITGGTVIDNTWYYVGDNNSGTVSIVEIYNASSVLTGDRTVSLGNYELVFSGSHPNQVKFINLDEGGQTIETGNSGGINFNVDSSGNLFANSKSFLIKNINKDGYKLRHGSVEGPENGVYFRGTSINSILELPEYWSWLVDIESVTVMLTSYCGDEIFVEEITESAVIVGGNNCEFSYVIYGEIKDIGKMDIEPIISVNI